MKFKIGDKILFHEDYRKYDGPIYEHEGEIKGFSKGTDRVFGEYEVSFLHEYSKIWQKFVVKEEDLSYNICEIRNQKIDSILNI